MREDSRETKGLLARTAEADRDAWGSLLVRHADRLRHMITLRIDPRIRSRIEPADVLQEAFIEASNRLDDYLADPVMPFYIWIRFIVGQKLVTLHRHHLGTDKRDASREIPFLQSAPGMTSLAIADHLISLGTGPSEAAVREELSRQVQHALDSMDEIDREILVLRHFEQLTRTEAAQTLQISEAACAKRYLRALKRLKEVLGDSNPLDSAV